MYINRSARWPALNVPTKDADLSQTRRKTARKHSLVDTVKSRAPEIKLAIFNGLLSPSFLYKVARGGPAGYRLFGNRLSLVYFGTARGVKINSPVDASNPFRGCTRFPRGSREIKAQLRRRLRGHLSSGASHDRNRSKLRPPLCRAVQLSGYVFISFYFLFPRRIVARHRSYPVRYEKTPPRWNDRFPEFFSFFSPLFTPMLSTLAIVSFSVRHERGGPA